MSVQQLWLLQTSCPSPLSLHTDPGSMLWKLMFTIRDSPSDYANVVCWGSEAYIPSLSDSFRINDVVEIKNPSIQTKGAGDDRWRPTTSRWAGRRGAHVG